MSMKNSRAVHEFLRNNDENNFFVQSIHKQIYAHS